MREEARLSLQDVVDRAVRSMAAALGEDWNVPSERISPGGLACRGAAVVGILSSRSIRVEGAR
jgi:hypothetical protein